MFGKKENEAQPQKENRIAKNLVELIFDSGTKLSYLSDFENIKIGDIVTVEGKMEKQTGLVNRVLTCFKKPKFEMKWITSIVDTQITGSYFGIDKFVFSFDSNLTPKKLFNIHIGQSYEENPAIGDDNLMIDLANVESCNLFKNDLVKIRGNDLYNKDAVKFISLNNGVGKAIVVGGDYYEIDFRYKDGYVTYLACDCPYFDECKHLYAFLLTMRDVCKKLFEKYDEKNFVMCNKHYFFSVLKFSTGKITLDL